MDANQAAFLAALTALSQQHGFVISGCGCCGSPSVDPAPDDAAKGWYVLDNEYAGQLLFISPSDQCNWEKYGAPA